MRVPGFLLRRLYVKGSLRLTNSGFEFDLCNRLGSGFARRLLPLSVDGVDISTSLTSFEVNGKRTYFDQVSQDLPFTLALNKTTTIRVQDWRLGATAHKFIMCFEVAGLGELAFDFTDAPRNAKE